MSDIKNNNEAPFASDVERAPFATTYESIIASMNPHRLADLGVKLVVVNSSELFWVTSTGQLYAFGDRQAALSAELSWLLSEPRN